MGLQMTSVSNSGMAVAIPSFSSLRADISTLYRRLDLAPSVLVIAGLSFLIHLLSANNYGYFRDELYFMAMSQHPAFGYVDVPPLVPWITLIPRFLTGNALWALHLLSALICAGTIVLTGVMARLLGGSGWVQGLAALGSATSLVLLAGGSTYTYDVFDQFWWALADRFGWPLTRPAKPACNLRTTLLSSSCATPRNPSTSCGPRPRISNSGRVLARNRVEHVPRDCPTNHLSRHISRAAFSARSAEPAPSR